MKKLLLATAIAALSVSAANAAPQVYGKAFVTADYVNIDINDRYSNTLGDVDNNDFDENTVEINSHASRLGFKGSEAISANTDLIYQLEYGIKVDGDNGSNDVAFKSRDTFLGVKNKDFGEFRVGRNTSVLDYVNNVTVTQGYWDNLGSNTLSDDSDIIEALNMVSDSRQNNSVVWIAPKYNGVPVELALQYAADEKFVDSNNGYGASLMFDQGTGFTAGLAYTKDMDANGGPFYNYITDEVIASRKGDIIRGTVTADLGKYMAAPVTLGALYQVADFDYAGSTKEKGLVVSGEMGLTNFAKPASVYLQYNRTDNLSGVDNFDSNQVVLGGKYKYKPNMIAHAYVGQNSAKGDYNNTFAADAFGPGSPAFTETGSLDADAFAIGGGLEYIF